MVSYSHFHIVTFIYKVPINQSPGYLTKLYVYLICTSVCPQHIFVPIALVWHAWNTAMTFEDNRTQSPSSQLTCGNSYNKIDQEIDWGNHPILLITISALAVADWQHTNAEDLVRLTNLEVKYGNISCQHEITSTIRIDRNVFIDWRLFMLQRSCWRISRGKGRHNI